MSPSWRDRVVVHVTRGAVRVRRHARGWKPVAQAVDEAGWDPSDLPSLRAPLLALLGGGGARGRARASVVLSNDLVRFAVLDGAEALRGPAEHLAAARHRLRAIHGAAADGWRCAVDVVSGAPGLVAAADAELVDGLVDACRTAGLPLDRVEPWLAVASRSCAVSPDAHLFVAAESEKVVIASVRAGRIAGLRSARLRGELGDQLPRLLDQERVLAGGEVAEGRVTVACDAGPVPTFASAAGWRIVGQVCDPTMIPGRRRP